MSKSVSTSTRGTQLSSRELVQRAQRFLEREGRPLPPQELLPEVFGHDCGRVKGRTGAGPGVQLWGKLLDQILGNAPQFVKQADGLWGLRAWQENEQRLTGLRCVVIDIETTGLRPDRHCIIEVAALRVTGGKIEETFTSLVHPRRRVPQFITSFTGISQELVDTAPAIEEVLPRLLDFVGTDLVVGHNIAFDLGFIGYVAIQLGLSFSPESLDTILLSRLLIPQLRRPKLANLARHYGVLARDQHRAYGDARTTAEVLAHLLALAQEQGLQTLADLRRVLEGTDGRSRGTLASRPLGSLFLNPAWRREFPEKPGVYLMKDEQGEIIYIGKAKCLRDRLASYYNQPMGYNRKLDGLLQSVKEIEVRVLGSELEALLVESSLIKEHQPRFNVQLRNYETYPFIKIDVGHAFPRIYSCREVTSDGARYFGPFSSGRMVEITLDLIHTLFPVRTCTRSLPPDAPPSTPCLRYHMHRCLAPCMTATVQEDYRKAIDEVIAFLGGRQEDLLVRLRQEIWAAANQLKFERAAKLRDTLFTAEKILTGQRLLIGAVEANNLLIVYPSVVADCYEIFIIRHSRLLHQVRVPQQEAAFAAALGPYLEEAAALGPAPHTIGKAEVDQINIISHWLYRHSNDPAFFTLPDDLRQAMRREDFLAHILETCAASLAGNAGKDQAEKGPFGAEDEEDPLLKQNSLLSRPDADTSNSLLEVLE